MSVESLDNVEFTNNTVQSDSVLRVATRLPPLWKSNITVWFIQVEASFNVSRITNDETKYNYLLSAIDADTLSAVTDLIIAPPEGNKYQALKDRLVKEFSDSQSSQIRKLLCELTLEKITSDQGRQFESELFRQLTRFIGAEKIRTSPYHPQSNGLIENWHRPLKCALKARRNEKWTEVLPTILLGFRAAIKTDLNVSPAELVYETSLRLPGDFFDEHSVIKSPETMIQKLRDIFHDFAPLPTKSHSNIKPFVSQDLKTCTHVFIRNDGVRKSLQPPYNGPYAVIKRGAKVFKVMIKGKNVTVSVDRLKPAFLSADKDNVNQPEEEMLRLCKKLTRRVARPLPDLVHSRTNGISVSCATIKAQMHDTRQAVSKPSFAEPIPNTTATLGRDAILKCTIDDLDGFKVAWIKLDTQTLLSYQTHVISRDRRLKITNSNKRQWFLHIKDVNVLDRGYYMCQINTEPMISQAGYLDVMVPPSIVEEDTSTDTVVEERAKVSLRCGASGYPSPQISWRRENQKDINLGPVGNTENIVQRVEGEFLNLTQVTREDMGAYLCIASNGVPPSVSKRILLQVNFQPKIRVANQMVRSSMGTEAVLGCHLEASPRPLTSWIRHDDVVLINNYKYELHEIEDSYKILMQLKIKNITEDDFGYYKCVAKNTFGDKEGFVRLIEIPPTTSTTQSTIPYKVFVAVQRVVTESQPVQEWTTFQKKEFGAPTTNSLRDVSHVVSSEKQLLPGKVQSRMEDEKQQKRTTNTSPHSNKSSSQATRNHILPVPGLLFAILLTVVYQNMLRM
ncbi:hemicentin-1-like [Uloborus diversus]|uniref:hemicentin-1-like n=1 Tax=Uloborus diversus TaxID=327109 RepID=UPI00240A8F4A|nr:hemicentin-1-like [Uloborus diversus]